MMRGEGKTVEGSPCRSRFGCRCAIWRMGSSSGAMSGPLRPPGWAGTTDPSADSRWNLHKPERHKPERPAVADHSTVADQSEAEEHSEFDSGCNAESQIGDSQDECAPFRPRSAVADRDPLPGRQKCWPDSSDKDVIGSEPRQTRVAGVPPRREREAGRVREHHLLQDKQREANNASALLLREGVDNGEPKRFGNCGFQFCSFGQDAGTDQKKADEWNQMKRSPANILVVTESTDALFDYLGRDPGLDKQEWERDPSAVAGTEVVECLRERECRQWLGIKGGEPAGTPLIAVRNTAGVSLECVWWEKKTFGKLKGKNTYSRVLICRVTLDYPVIGLGDVFNIMCIHVHNSLGAPAPHGPSQKKLNNVYTWFADMLVEHDVQVVCGDFNMLMLPMFAHCRSRGMDVDLAAWSAFRIIPGGKPAWDSCAGFFVNAPGSYKLASGGRLSELEQIATAGWPTNEAGQLIYKSFRAKDDKGMPGAEAPGWTSEHYAPRDAPIAEKLREFLTPSAGSAEALRNAQVGARKTKTTEGQNNITVRQKDPPWRNFKASLASTGRGHTCLCCSSRRGQATGASLPKGTGARSGEPTARTGFLPRTPRTAPTQKASQGQPIPRRSCGHAPHAQQ